MLHEKKRIWTNEVRQTAIKRTGCLGTMLKIMAYISFGVSLGEWFRLVVDIIHVLYRKISCILHVICRAHKIGRDRDRASVKKSLYTGRDINDGIVAMTRTATMTMFATWFFSCLLRLPPPFSLSLSRSNQTSKLSYAISRKQHRTLSKITLA